MSQAGLLQMKPCWQKGLAGSKREKQEVVYFKGSCGRKFWLFIGQVDSQGFVLLEILYPGKLAVVSAWVLPNCTPESEVSYERGGKKQNKQKTLYTLQLQRKCLETQRPGLCSCLESAISLKQYLWEEWTVLVISVHVRYEAWQVYTAASSFQCFFFVKINVMHAFWEYIFSGHTKQTRRKVYYLSCKQELMLNITLPFFSSHPTTPNEKGGGKARNFSNCREMDKHGIFSLPTRKSFSHIQTLEKNQNKTPFFLLTPTFSVVPYAPN